MSSYIQFAKNPKTGKVQQALFLDDYFGSHNYGVAFRKDGRDAMWDDTKIEDCDVFKIEEIKEQYD